MSRFKTVFAVFFLVIFTFNVIIYYSLFEFSEIQVKAEMSETISKLHSLDQTGKFILPLSSLNQIRHDEIWLNGNLYDIVKTEIKHDSVVVYVLGDKKEEGLVEKMKAHQEQDTDKVTTTHSGGHASKKNVSKSPQKYFPNAAIISFHRDMNDKVTSCEVNCFYTTALPPVQSPPPEHTVS
jgi:hypothetical protein